MDTEKTVVFFEIVVNMKSMGPKFKISRLPVKHNLKDRVVYDFTFVSVSPLTLLPDSVSYMFPIFGRGAGRRGVMDASTLWGRAGGGGLCSGQSHFKRGRGLLDSRGSATRQALHAILN